MPTVQTSTGTYEITEAELASSPTLTVPSTVTVLQARRALAAAGLRSTVESYIANQSQDVQDHWQYATVFERDSQFIADAVTALGLSEQDVDNLFVQAAQL